jgi:2-polyprenyl-6-methoxyphenol hydroxylase-like FAD-dependent oxidoreductase
MRVAILGAGPAGLYLAYLLKRRHRTAQVRVYEQNSADATFGFGVVFSDRALEFLNEDDPETHAAITPLLESWRDITISHREETITIDGIGFAAIGRLKLLKLLQTRATSTGVELLHGRAIRDLSELADADLIVGADGVNSLVRRTHADALGATVGQLSNRFAWFGAGTAFPTLTQTFRETSRGFFNAHHYRYEPGRSTFIVETDEETFCKNGFEQLGQEETIAVCEEVFTDALQGARLISNNSVWRRFPLVRCVRWTHENCVIIGDAAHTAHFSIGSGTRLALEDAIALDKALADGADILKALAVYETARRPVLEKIVTAASGSAEWYEHFPDKMQLAPLDFAINYIMRSGRIEKDKLRKLSPGFVAEIEQSGRTLP